MLFNEKNVMKVIYWLKLKVTEDIQTQGSVFKVFFLNTLFFLKGWLFINLPSRTSDGRIQLSLY